MKGSSNSGTGVGDTVVNQLLAKMDGVNSLNNILVVGMTNRKDLIDEALLRPGRFEVQEEITLPDEILKIHTALMAKGGYLSSDVSLPDIAKWTKNFSGAEIEGLVRGALSFAISRTTNFDKLFGMGEGDGRDNLAKEKKPLVVTQNDFQMAVKDITPMFGVAENTLTKYLLNGIIDYGPRFTRFYNTLLDMVRIDTRTPSSPSSPSSSSSSSSSRSSGSSSASALPAFSGLSTTWRFATVLSGPSGCGKTAVAAEVARQSEYPFIRVISPDWLNSRATDQIGVCRVINQAFHDADKSVLSLMIIDNYEAIIRYQNDQNYSLSIAQMLQDCITAPPTPGHSIFIITTTSKFDELSGKLVDYTLDEELDTSKKKRRNLANARRQGVNHFTGYNSVVKVPCLMEVDEISLALKAINPTWKRTSYEDVAKQILDVVTSIPIKLLLDTSRFADRKAKGEESSKVFLECLEMLLNVY